MLVSEFYERTGVEVSIDEFWAINEAYNRFSGNKDEFCALWVKENKERVKASKDAEKSAKVEAKKAERFKKALYKATESKKNELSFDFACFKHSYMEAYIIRFANAVKMSVSEVIEMSIKYSDYSVFNRGIIGILLYRLSNVTI